MNPEHRLPEDEDDDFMDATAFLGDSSASLSEFNPDSSGFGAIDHLPTSDPDDEPMDVEDRVSASSPEDGIMDPVARVSVAADEDGIMDPVARVPVKPSDDEDIMDPDDRVPGVTKPVIPPDVVVPGKEIGSTSGRDFLKLAGVGSVCAALAAGLMFAFATPSGNQSVLEKIEAARSRGDDRSVKDAIETIEPESGEIPRQATVPNDIKIQKLMDEGEPEASLQIPLDSLYVLLLVALQDAPRPQLSPRQEEIIRTCDENIKLDLGAIEKFRKNPSEAADVAERQYHLARTYALRANAFLPKYVKEATDGFEQAIAAYADAGKTEATLTPGANKGHVARSQGAASDRIQPLKARIADLKRLVDQQGRLLAFANGISGSLDARAEELKSVDDVKLDSLKKDVSDAVTQRDQARADLVAYQKIAVPDADPANPGGVAELTKAINDLAASRAKLRQQLLAVVNKVGRVMDGDAKDSEGVDDASVAATNENLEKLAGSRADRKQFVDFARILSGRFGLKSDPEKTADAWVKEAVPKVIRNETPVNNIAQDEDRRLLNLWAKFAAKEQSILKIESVNSPTAGQDPSPWITEAEGAISKQMARFDYVESTWAKYADNIARATKYSVIPAARWSKVPDQATEEWLKGLVNAVPSTSTENPKTKSLEFYALGLTAFRGREYVSALGLFDKAIALYAQDARYFYYRGLAKQLRPIGKVSPTPVDAPADMKAGYRLELANSPGSREVDLALMPVQFETRTWVESFRNPSVVQAASPAPVATPGEYSITPASYPIVSTPMPVASPMNMSRTYPVFQPWWKTLWAR